MFQFSVKWKLNKNRIKKDNIETEFSINLSQIPMKFWEITIKSLCRLELILRYYLLKFNIVTVNSNKIIEKFEEFKCTLLLSEN